MIAYPNIDPVAVDFGFVQIHWYGISYVVGILLAWWMLKLRASKDWYRYNQEQVADIIFYGMLGVIIGGRLGSVLFYNLPHYLEQPLDIFKIWQGGMSFHGGLIGVLIAMWLFARRMDQSFFNLVDFIAPVVPIGLCTGRIGNFINGELWGGPSELPWAIIYKGIARHPSQLYEAFFEGIVLFIILWWFSSKPRPVMSVGGVFLVGYGVFRSMIELVRVPDQHIGYLAFDWVTMGHVLSMPMIILGSVLIIMAYRNKTL